MFDNVMVGIDGRQGGRDALALARRLAAPGAAFILAHTYAPFPGRSAALAQPLEQAEAEQLLQRERDLAGLSCSLRTRCAAVGRGLHELAEESGADLLVVGSTRRALLGRTLLGDDARAALNGAPCAIAIAPRGHAHVHTPPRRIGVGYDGSPESERALACGRDLAARLGARLKAIWIVSLQNVREEEPIPADWPQAAEELVERCAERLSQMEGVHGIATYGDPREELARFGKDLDLLIVGSRGYGPLRRLFLGTVSGYLLGQGPCPLLVLPRVPVTGEKRPQRERAPTSAGVGAGTRA